MHRSSRHATSRWLAALLFSAAFACRADPLVIAHRGASGYLPEHTLAGYELAIRLGADFIEPDLQLTRDGVLVAMHDDTLQRTTDAADRFAARNGSYRVADFTLAEIRTLTVVPTGTAAASYPGFVPANAESRVPTFDDVIALVRSRSGTGPHPIGIYPEAKQADPAMEDKILAALGRAGYDGARGDVFLQSFSDATLRSLDVKQRALGTDVPQILLGSAVVMPDGSARIGVRGNVTLSFDDVAGFTEGIAVNISNPKLPVTKDFVDQAHAAGLQVHGWTFAQPDRALAAAEYRQYLEMGLDGVFTNYADLAVEARDRFVASRPAR